MTQLPPSPSSLIVMSLLQKKGFSLDAQLRIGTFAILWGIFETSLESALWILRGENVKGAQPSTDMEKVSDQIKSLDKEWAQLTPEALKVLKHTSKAALDLMEYRHSLMHGVPSPLGFVRNPRWHGEIRKRKSHVSHIDSNLLDLAIQSGLTLCQALQALQSSPSDSGAALLALKKDISDARSISNELCHLTELMNHEKY